MYSSRMPFVFEAQIHTNVFKSVVLIRWGDAKQFLLFLSAENKSNLENETQIQI